MLVEEAADGAPRDAAMARLVEVADAFTAEFFDTKTCRFRRSAATTDYWRAADQAMGCLACLKLACLGHRTAESRAMASCAADSLLREYGYSLYATEGQPPGTYLGRVAPRNSWHDCLASFALLTSGVLGVGGETGEGLVRELAASYTDPAPGSSTMLHEPSERRTDVSSSGDGSPPPVAFSSTQALWSAVVRAADTKGSRRAEGADVPALRAFHEAHALAERDGLLPVANVYPDARLWANTEWAAFVLLEKSDFLLPRDSTD